MQVPNDILLPEFDQLIKEGKQVCFTPSGVSMRPFIEGNRDSVTLAAAEHPEVGDILLAKIGNRYVLHRLIAIQGNELTLMGDGNLTGEEHCTKADIIGKVIAITRPNGNNKRLTKGRLWWHLKPLRRLLLKIYRHICI